MSTEENSTFDLNEDLENQQLREALSLVERVRETLVLPENERVKAQKALAPRLKDLETRMKSST